MAEPGKPGPWSRPTGDGGEGVSQIDSSSGARPTTVALKATDFPAAQRANRQNTFWLIVLLLTLGAIFGYALGLLAALLGSADPDAFDPLLPHREGFVGAAIFVGIGVVASLVAILAGDRVVIGLTGARDVTVDEEPVLHNVVEEMAIASGQPKPRVVVIETEALNAFATGMRPERAALGVTRGLLDTLNRSELQGVVAHEMGHIANWDTRYMTAVAILVGLIVLVADGIRRALYYGSRGIGRGIGRGSRKGGGAAVLVIMLVLLVFSILMPIAAMMVRFAVSRQREYLADATSVAFTRNPAGLIGALQKIASAAQPFKGANRATQHMFIVNPFRHFEGGGNALTATHPPLQERIERLRNLGNH
jgi:heat shock protein HtpX